MAERELDDQENESVAAWVAHPMTVHVAKGLQDEADKALQELIGYAAKSTDANCSKFAARYRTLVQTRKTILGEK